MTLADRLKEVQQKLPCPFATTLASMKPEDRKALEQAFQDNLPWRAIQRALRAEGYKTSTEAMTAHRKGDCRCPK